MRSLSLVAKSYLCLGISQQKAYKLSMLAMSEALLFHYLSRALVEQASLCRRWLYAIWEAAARCYIHTGQLNYDLFVRTRTLTDPVAG